VLKRCFLITAAAVLAGAASAAAQNIVSPYAFVERSQGVFAYATYVFTDRGTIEIGPHSGPAAGIGYAIRVSGPFTLDSRLAFFPTSRTVFNLEAAPGDPDAIREDPMVGLEEVGTADLSLLLADLSLRFDITGPRTWNNIQPYALLGLGGVFRAAAEHAAEEFIREDIDLRVRFRNGFTGHVGAGLEYYLSPRATLRLDARNLFWRLHVPAGFITPDRVIDDREWVQVPNLSVGASFRF
jgi:opacity protein-like surface antigen